jgi:peptidyl-prolyl cis-trans isomerase D
MIGTIRKHSKVLWAFIITAVIISFIYWGVGSSQVGGAGGRATGDFGSINGRKVTPSAFAGAMNEFRLFYLFHYGTWPDKKSNVTEADMEREAYIRLLLTQKADELGIHCGVDEVAAMAGQMIRSLGRNSHTVTMEEFTQQVLTPNNLTVLDFENFVRHDLYIQQLVQALGLSSAFVTPQEAASVYTREHQELSTQIVFFPATNYLSSVKVTPEAIAQFYTNYLAAYRLPDRVQVSYVAFSVSNYLEQSKAEWAKTNFDAQIDSFYFQYGTQAFPDAKTPAEAKGKIRELLITQRAQAAAKAAVNDFAGAVFKLEPASAANLDTVAKAKGLKVHVTAPFSAAAGPQEFVAPEGFAKAAFGLTPDAPFANPIAGTDAIYVIALAKQLPSEIPPLAEIRDQVTLNYKFQEARLLAVRAGTNFVHTLAGSLAAGKSFSVACVAAGLSPQVLPPFSLSTRELPQLGEMAELNQVKQTAFTTPVGQASTFEQNNAGGFVLFVQSQLPVDAAAMNAELPQFITTLRRARENEAFNEWVNQSFGTWLQNEAGKALRDRLVPAGQ